MTIRREHPSDYAVVHELVKAAFKHSSHSDGTEADYLDALRTNDAFISELSFVAEHENGEIIGQIVLYKTFVTTLSEPFTALVLSPISVRPDYFRKGVATALMREALETAKELGYTAVFLCGDPSFYNKFGFISSFKYGIYHISDTNKDAPWCMALELFPSALKDIHGTIV